VEVILARVRLVLLALLLSCSENAAPLTELVVVVDSDLTVPAQLDEIRVVAAGPDGDMQTASARLGQDQPPLPRNVVLRHQGGPLGPFDVRVEGRRGGGNVLTREAEVSFERDRSLVLPMHLVSVCRNTSCPDDESCTEHGCQPRAVDTDQLEEWSGEKPELEPGSTPAQDGGRPDASADGGAPADAAGVPDTGMCVPRPEVCNGADDDCDGRRDNGFDLNNDENNCGRCGLQCNDRRGEVCCRGFCAPGCQ
jgi:hypothetical protein